MAENPDRVAIVTAAGRGMGAACARELASRGYRVALMSISDAASELAAPPGEEGFSSGSRGQGQGPAHRHPSSRPEYQAATRFSAWEP